MLKNSYRLPRFYKEISTIYGGQNMIIDGVLVGVVLAGLELGVAWILACVINHEPASEKKEEKEPPLTFSASFANFAD